MQCSVFYGTVYKRRRVCMPVCQTLLVLYRSNQRRVMSEELYVNNENQVTR